VPSSIVGTTLIPPFRFGRVEETVFRSAYPTEVNLRFLKRLRLKTILCVIPSPPTDSLLAFSKAQGIDIEHIQVDKYKEKNPLTDAAVIKILEVHPLGLSSAPLSLSSAPLSSLILRRLLLNRRSCRF